MKTCSVIICAHDEEQSIGTLLTGVYSQRMPDGWTLREVLVVADGCRDGTERIVRGIAAVHPNLRLMSLPYPNRGKSLAFNEAIPTLSDEVVVMLDADVTLADGAVVARLLGAVDAGALLVSGNDIPEPLPIRSWGHAASLGRHLIKQGMKRAGYGVFSCVGRCLAMHRRFYDGLQVPDVPGEDNFRFLTALERGMPYAYVSDAVVLFTPARTVADYIRQHTRFWHGVAAFTPRYGSAVYGTAADRLRVVFAAAVRHPVVMSAWAAAALAGQIRYWWERFILRTPQTGRWERATSTK